MRRSRKKGEPTWTSIGAYPAVSLKEARETELATPKSDVLVSTCYDDWLIHIKRAYKSTDRVVSRMNKHFIPAFGARMLTSITRAELADHLKSIAATAPIQGNRVLTDMKLIFEHAIASGWTDDNPAERITQKIVGGKEKSRDRVLSEVELIELIGVLRSNRSGVRQKDTNFDERTRIALALALLTGQRSGELRAINKRQVKGSTWSIPKEVTKTDTDMKVYLPLVVLKLLNYTFKQYGNAPFKGVEGQSLSHATRYMKFTPTFRPHDLRRTMRTIMADLGVAPHIGEKCLNHKLSGVLAVYDRSEYAAEKRSAWRIWTRYLIGVARKKAPEVGA